MEGLVISKGCPRKSAELSVGRGPAWNLDTEGHFYSVGSKNKGGRPTAWDLERKQDFLCPFSSTLPPGCGPGSMSPAQEVELGMGHLIGHLLNFYCPTLGGRVTGRAHLPRSAQRELSCRQALRNLLQEGTDSSGKLAESQATAARFQRMKVGVQRLKGGIG